MSFALGQLIFVFVALVMHGAGLPGDLDLKYISFLLCFVCMILFFSCRRAHIGVKVEVGNNLSRDHSKTRPADILLPNWFLGRTATLDVSITSLLNPVNLLEAGVSATAAAQATESRKHHANDPKCSDLGWVCVPMVVETYGAWGKEATAIISSGASRLATSMCWPKSSVLNEINGRLNLHLVRANATAILSRIARVL